MDQDVRFVLARNNLQITDDVLYHLVTILYFDNKKLSHIMNIIALNSGEIVIIEDDSVKAIHDTIDEIFPNNIREHAHQVANQTLSKKQINFLDFYAIQSNLLRILIEDILLRANFIAISEGKNIIEISDIDMAVNRSSKQLINNPIILPTRSKIIQHPVIQQAMISQNTTRKSMSNKPIEPTILRRPILSTEVGKLTPINPMRLSTQSSAIQTPRSPYSVAELKQLLIERGLSTTGNKSTLVARLQEYLDNPDSEIL